MSVTDDFEYEYRGVVMKHGTSIPVSAELLADAAALRAILANPPAPRPKPTEPRIEDHGDELWIVWREGDEDDRVDAIFRTRDEAVAYWHAQVAIDSYACWSWIEGTTFDTITPSS